MKLPESAKARTLYFIGVSTTQSSIMKVYPAWAKEALDLADTKIVGIDMPIHAPREDYRQVVDFIKNDPLSMGALVTTHKIDLYEACKDMFDYLDPYAQTFGELSSISKKEGKLEGYAKDPISSGLTMENFIPKDFFKNHSGEVFIMGAGGSAIAISAYLLNPDRAPNIPTKLIVTNRSQPRLDELARIVKAINPHVPVEYHLADEEGKNDEILARIKPYSLVVNATGLGKDRPGSPLGDEAVFPKNSLVWELNYRGALDFMKQAEAQKEKQELYIEDGWIYFIHGWTQVIAEVFHIDIVGDKLAKCDQIASRMR